MALVSAHKDLSLGGDVVHVNVPQDGRLARPAGAGEKGEFAALEKETDVVEYDVFVFDHLGDVGELYHGFLSRKCMRVEEDRARLKV